MFARKASRRIRFRCPCLLAAFRQGNGQLWSAYLVVQDITIVFDVNDTLSLRERAHRKIGTGLNKLEMTRRPLAQEHDEHLGPGRGSGSPPSRSFR